MTRRACRCWRTSTGGRYANGGTDPLHGTAGERRKWAGTAFWVGRRRTASTKPRARPTTLRQSGAPKRHAPVHGMANTRRSVRSREPTGGTCTGACTHPHAPNGCVHICTQEAAAAAETEAALSGTTDAVQASTRSRRLGVFCYSCRAAFLAESVVKTAGTTCCVCGGTGVRPPERNRRRPKVCVCMGRKWLKFTRNPPLNAI